MINDNFCRIKSALSNGILEVKCTLGFYTQTSHFLEEIKELGRSYHPVVKKNFWIMFFTAKLLQLDILRTQKQLSSHMISGNDGWFSCRISYFTKISSLKRFDWRGKNGSRNFINVDIVEVLMYSFVQVWSM